MPKKLPIISCTLLCSSRSGGIPAHHDAELFDTVQIRTFGSFLLASSVGRLEVGPFENYCGSLATGSFFWKGKVRFPGES